MATVSGATLKITNVNDTMVEAKVEYTMTSNALETGKVFSESIKLIGDDPGVTSDKVIFTFPVETFVAGSVTTGATSTSARRTRLANLLKSRLNEDPEFKKTGAERQDEVFARIMVTFGGNPPILETATTNIVTGAWKS